jgi:hypothetical protein
MLNKWENGLEYMENLICEHRNNPSDPKRTCCNASDDRSSPLIRLGAILAAPQNLFSNLFSALHFYPEKTAERPRR